MNSRWERGGLVSYLSEQTNNLIRIGFLSKEDQTIRYVIKSDTQRIFDKTFITNFETSF